jgi:hypothetical integral membrane protein (TIGR02206 family)
MNFLRDGPRGLHMHVASELQSFQAGSATHLAVVAGLLICVAGICRAGRTAATSISARESRGFDRRLANVVLGVWVLIFLRDLRPDRLAWVNSLPLHFCDIVGLTAVLALRDARRRWTRAIVFFWGLAICAQAFCFPVLRAGPIHSDFWLYWLQHGVIVAAAIYDVTVREYRPTWRDWRLISIALGAYAIAIVPLNVLLNANYGYLGSMEEAQRSTVAAFGPWPDRLPTMYLTACALMAAMLAPFRWTWSEWRSMAAAQALPARSMTPPMAMVIHPAPGNVR